VLTRRRAEELLDEVMDLKSELDEAECKSGAGDALKKAMCAMSNRRDRNGGVVFVGVGEDCLPVGAKDIEGIQKLIADWASDPGLFSVPLRVAIEVLSRKGKSVLAVVVPACPAGHRPCHFVSDGPYEGSWIRVGNSDRKMTRDEVRREITEDELARGSVSPFDKTPYVQAGLDALDDDLMTDYVAKVRKLRPASRIDAENRDKFLRGVSAIAEHEGKWHPTPAGLLFFCRTPERYLPQAGVEFLHLWGPEFTSPGPDGSMWRENRLISGPLPKVIEEVKQALLDRMATRGVLNGFQRQDKPEYPEFVLREAVVNAVAHRDYTLRGSRIQIRLYPDRIEFQSPGGLLPPVTVENIEDEHATRNEAIVGLLGELDYMEERGRGFDGIMRELRKEGLAPPQMIDRGSSFTLTIRSHILMAPETLEWLKRFSKLDLSPQERLGMAYLRVNARLYNRDYVRLNACTRDEATQALRSMVRKGALRMHSARGGAYYVLPDKLSRPASELSGETRSDDERVLELARTRGRISRHDVVEQLQISEKKANALLLKLRRRGQLVSNGRKKGTAYSLPDAP
jgi:ATP-dependent DNA helicase RecG